MEKGKKFDAGKPIIDLVEPDFILGMAKVLTYGANTYGMYNWQEDLELYRIRSALLRHYIAYRKGEKSDKDTGLSHLLHLAVNAMFLYWYETKKNTPDFTCGVDFTHD